MGMPHIRTRVVVLTCLELRLQDNDVGNEGATALGEALQNNSTLSQLLCVALRRLLMHTVRAAHCTRPGTVSCAVACGCGCVGCRLADNDIGDVGAGALGEGLKENSGLTELRCVFARPRLAAPPSEVTGCHPYGPGPLWMGPHLAWPCWRGAA